MFWYQRWIPLVCYASTSIYPLFSLFLLLLLLFLHTELRIYEDSGNISSLNIMWMRAQHKYFSRFCNIHCNYNLTLYFHGLILLYTTTETKWYLLYDWSQFFTGQFQKVNKYTTTMAFLRFEDVSVSAIWAKYLSRMRLRSQCTSRIYHINASLWSEAQTALPLSIMQQTSSHRPTSDVWCVNCIDLDNKIKETKIK